ncbi:PPOX class F420-dependent oxidoreductase [Actinophytocola xanthii]|uniref:PPOX class F420-dependent enzyme n=1 Tax=Actinophytocola xanthii TaxID=1912961 RepID=A0A1Q8CYQ0_9PSEU|nr:PPOX class F420-dependent oxidoreductase [Actinophytocola xanthii]OLF19491.1 PPOX class F420-dependent enzyme [Actinophytocola xanthii]
MAITFDERTRALLDGRNFAVVATLSAGGAPQTSVVWIARDGDTVVFSSTADRQKTRNLTRDPRVSLSVFDLENPYESVDIRGTAELAEDHDHAVQKAVSHKYLGEDPPTEPDTVTRVAVRVVPHRVHHFSA